jgi:NADP-dependent 3-hydroxy acid dehydrogenase YdfG
VPPSRVVRSCEAELGPVEILVNNAGVPSRALLQELSDAEWHRLFQVNVDAAFALCRVVVPGMCRRG